MGRVSGFLVALLFSLYASASEVPLATVTLGASATTYVATAGAAVVLQCPGLVVRYAPGSSGAPPTATITSLRLDFTVKPEGWPIQLAPSEDRISILGTSGGKCYVFTQTTPAVTTVTNLAASQCVVYLQTVVAVGTAAGGVLVPTASQTKRLGVEICISAENPGLPKAKCLVDGTPVMGVANPGDLLVIGGKVCQFYPVDSSHPIKCIADTASTAVLTGECVPP